MMVKIFWQDNCPHCPAAKEVGKELEGKDIVVEYHDIRSIDGMSEALFFNILASPSILITDGNGEIASWRGNVPTAEEILGAINGRA